MFPRHGAPRRAVIGGRDLASGAVPAGFQRDSAGESASCGDLARRADLSRSAVTISRVCRRAGRGRAEGKLGRMSNKLSRLNGFRTRVR